MTHSKYVVTITRQFGSLGRPIAKRISEILDIEYYDRDLVDEAARKLKLPVSVVDREEESARKLPYNPFTRMKYRKRRPASSWDAAPILFWRR